MLVASSRGLRVSLTNHEGAINLTTKIEGCIEGFFETSSPFYSTFDLEPRDKATDVPQGESNLV